MGNVRQSITKSIKYRRGFGAVEGLVALAAMGSVFLGVTQIMKYVNQGTRRTRIISTMIAADAALNSALEEPATIQPFKTALSTNNLPNMTVNYLGTTLAQFSNLGPVPTYLTVEGATCNNPGAGSCQIQVDFHIYNNAGNWNYLYRISSLDSGGASSPLAPMGIQAPSAVVPYDLKALRDADPLTFDALATQIRAALYKPDVETSCLNVGGKGLFMQGYNQATGKVTCWNSPTANSCPAGTMVIGLYAGNASFSTAAASGPALTSPTCPADTICVKCIAMNQINCWGNYALQTGADLRSLDPRYSPIVNHGEKCVYRGVDTSSTFMGANAGPKPAPGGSTNSPPYVCPSDYRVSSASTCSLNVPAFQNPVFTRLTGITGYQ